MSNLKKILLATVLAAPFAMANAAPASQTSGLEGVPNGTELSARDKICKAAAGASLQKYQACMAKHK